MFFKANGLPTRMQEESSRYGGEDFPDLLKNCYLIKSFKSELDVPSLQFLARFAINLTAIPLSYELPPVFELQVFQILRKTLSISLL